MINTVDGVSDQYQEFMKRGDKLLKTPNCAPFLAPLIEKFEMLWKESNVKSKERLDMLTSKSKEFKMLKRSNKNVKYSKVNSNKSQKVRQPQNNLIEFMVLICNLLKLQFFFDV